MNMQDIVTCTEIAKRKDLDKETIRRWCREGRLPAFKVGKEWLVREADLQALEPVAAG